jgi:methionyl-tRNA formyltransferase
MKVVCFANNVVGLETVRYLREVDAEIVALVVHEPGKQKLTDEIISTADVAPENMIQADRLNDSSTIELIKALNPDCGVSAFFGHILRKPIIDIFPKGIVNLHTSLLPVNRGSWPNVWTIVDQTQAGVSMHLVDEGVDTGPVLAQASLNVCPSDTGLSLNRRLESALIELFRANWDNFALGKLKPQPQDESKATLHRVKDASTTDRVDLDAMVRAGDLINILRARTSPPHRGAWFEVDGQKYFMELKIEKE